MKVWRIPGHLIFLKHLNEPLPNFVNLIQDLSNLKSFTDFRQFGRHTVWSPANVLLKSLESIGYGCVIVMPCARAWLPKHSSKNNSQLLDGFLMAKGLYLVQSCPLGFCDLLIWPGSRSLPKKSGNLYGLHRAGAVLCHCDHLHCAFTRT